MTDKYIIINKIDEEIELNSHWVGIRAEAMNIALKNLRQWIVEEVE